jgi:hypothetical protein
MSKNKHPKIISVTHIISFSVLIDLSNGKSFPINLKSIIFSSPELVSVKDPAIFKKVSISSDGKKLTWENGTSLELSKILKLHDDVS